MIMSNELKSTSRPSVTRFQDFQSPEEKTSGPQATLSVHKFNYYFWCFLRTLRKNLIGLRSYSGYFSSVKQCNRANKLMTQDRSKS